MAKRIELDLEEVARLAGLGLTEVEIGISLGVSRATVQRRRADNEAFEAAIRRGKAAARQVVGNRLFELCQDSNLGAIIWYEKTRLGYSDSVTHKGDADAPIAIVSRIVAVKPDADSP